MTLIFKPVLVALAVAVSAPAWSQGAAPAYTWADSLRGNAVRRIWLDGQVAFCCMPVPLLRVCRGLYAQRECELVQYRSRVSEFTIIWLRKSSVLLRQRYDKALFDPSLRAALQRCKPGDELLLSGLYVDDPYNSQTGCTRIQDLHVAIVP